MTERNVMLSLQKLNHFSKKSTQSESTSTSIHIPVIVIYKEKNAKVGLSFYSFLLYMK